MNLSLLSLKAGVCNAIATLSSVKRITISLLLSLATVSFVQAQATLTSDQQDYPPGSTVTLTGSSFQAGETVTLQVTHVGDGDNETSGAHAPWDVTANADGNFTTTWLVPTDEDELGAILLATADGQISGLHAETSFTDGTWTLSSNQVVCVNTNKQLTFTINSTGTPNNNSFRINFPTSFTISSPGIVSVSGGKTWSISISGTRYMFNESWWRLKRSTTWRMLLVFNVTVNASTTTGSPFTLTGFSDNNTGCPTTGTAPSSTATITVNALPVVTTANSCIGGGNVTFTQSGGGAGSWSVSGGGTINASTGVFTPTTAGCFTATYTTTSGSCSDTKNFVVFPSTPTLTAPSNTCASAFTLPTVTAVGGFTVQYSVDAGAFSASPTIPTTPGCHSIQARYVLTSACGGNAANTASPCGASNTVSVVIFPTAPNAPTVSGGCGNFTVTPPPSVSGFTIEYSFDDGGTWGANTPPTADNCTGYKIRTRYVTAADCGSTQQALQVQTHLVAHHLLL